MSAMLPGTVTSCPRPIDRAISCEGLITACATAGPAGTAASGASAHAAHSTVLKTRLFIVLPLTLRSLAVLLRAVVMVLSKSAHADPGDAAEIADPLRLAVEHRPGAATDGFDGRVLAAGDAHSRSGRP